MFLVFLEIHWAAISSGWINKTVWILTWQTKHDPDTIYPDTIYQYIYIKTDILWHISIYISIHICKKNQHSYIIGKTYRFFQNKKVIIFLTISCSSNIVF